MAFAQLTYRESLRDIETCLRTMGPKLYHAGFRGKIARSTLADANEHHDWRIYADFAHVLIAVAKRLYANDGFAVDLDAAAYAFDSTTIDLCLALFPWARFRRCKGAVKLHTLIDLRGNIPCFIRTPRRQDIAAVSRSPATDHVSRCRDAKAIRISDQQLDLARADHRAALQMPLAGRVVLQVDQAASADQGFLRDFPKRGEDPSMDCHQRLRTRGDCQKGTQARPESLRNPTNSERGPF
jgi:hypothetical protein